MDATCFVLGIVMILFILLLRRAMAREDNNTVPQRRELIGTGGKEEEIKGNTRYPERPASSEASETVTDGPPFHANGGSEKHDESDVDGDAEDDGTDLDAVYLTRAKPIQILQKLDDGGLKVDVEALRSILLHDSIGTKPISIVSIAGAFRLGKSFALNLFLRYFRNKGYDNEKWLDDKTGGSLYEGIRWKAGPVGHTMGIEIWSEPFIVENYTGEEFAVLLMDTQGNFDHRRDKQESVSVFALSTLLSSLQIFNVSKQIQTNDLEYLQCFAEYARASAETCGESSRHVPFQALLFLVRDWASPKTHPFGHEGGEKYLSEECLSGDAHDTSIKKYFAGCFEQLSCHLMPMPSHEVMVHDSSSRLKVSDIGDKFSDNVKSLAKNFLHPHKLEAKKIGGVVVNGNCLLEYMENCSEMMDGDKLPKITSLMETISESNNAATVTECVREYEVQIAEVLEVAKTWNEYDRIESKAWSVTMELFDRKTMYGGKSDIWMSQLRESVERSKQLYQTKLALKRIEIVRKSIKEWKDRCETRLSEALNVYFARTCDVAEVYKAGIAELKNLYDENRDESFLAEDVNQAKAAVDKSYEKRLGSVGWSNLGKGLLTTAAVVGIVATGGVGGVAIGAVAAGEVALATVAAGGTAALAWVRSVWNDRSLFRSKMKTD